MSRLAAALFLFGWTMQAQDWSLDRFFTRPYVWGTSPTQITWAKHAHVLGFLWNAKGGTFRDLYAYDADRKKLTRLTDLELLKDPFNDPDADKDKHRKNYVLPPGGLTSFDLSQDGSRAVFDYRGDLYVVSTSGGGQHRLTRTKAAEVSPKFAPDGTAVAFTQSQIYVLQLGGGMLEQVTDIRAPASLVDYEWSPDGTMFSYSVRPGPGRMLVIPNYSGEFVSSAPFPRTVAGDTSEVLQHFVINRDGVNPRSLDAGKGEAAAGLEWSEDSKHLLTGTTQKYKHEEVRVIDANTGKSTVVFEQADDRWVENIAMGWAPDSKKVWLTSDKSGFQHLYTVNLDGSDLRQITKGAWEIHKDPFSHNPQWIGGFIYYSSTQDGTAERQIYRVRAEGSALPERLSKREGLNIAVVSEDGQEQAALEADLKNPWDLYVNGARVTQSPLSTFYQLEWPESRFVHYPSLIDRKPVAARLLLPPGYDPASPHQKPRPAVVYIHGSGYATSVLKQWGSYQDLRFAFNNFLAHQGFVVLEMDYRGSTNYGRDWRSDVYLDMGGPDLQDVLGGVDYLKSLKNIDAAHIGIWGWSYGGFMTAAAMFRAPSVFQAGAAFSGVYDWENYNEHYTGERLTTPTENPEAYRRTSPIHFSSQLQNRFLLIHGMVDSNVLFQDAVQLSEKLIHEGKPFEEAFYPEENHGYLRDESLRDAFGRTARFFNQYLENHP